MPNHNRSDGAKPNRPERIRRWLEVTAAGALAAGALVTTTGCGAQEPAETPSSTSAIASPSPTHETETPAPTASPESFDPSTMTDQIEVGSDIVPNFQKQLATVSAMLPSQIDFTPNSASGAELSIAPDENSYSARLESAGNSIIVTRTLLPQQSPFNEDGSTAGDSENAYPYELYEEKVIITNSNYTLVVRAISSGNSIDPTGKGRWGAISTWTNGNGSGYLETAKDIQNEVSGYDIRTEDRVGETVTPGKPIQIKTSDLFGIAGAITRRNGPVAGFGNTVVLFTENGGSTIGFELYVEQNDVGQKDTVIFGMSPADIAEYAGEGNDWGISFTNIDNYPKEDVDLYENFRDAVEALPSGASTTSTTDTDSTRPAAASPTR